MWIFLTVYVWSFLYEKWINYIKQLNLKGNINIRKELFDTFDVICIQRYKISVYVFLNIIFNYLLFSHYVVVFNKTLYMKRLVIFKKFYKRFFFPQINSLNGTRIFSLMNHSTEFSKILEIKLKYFKKIH